FASGTVNFLGERRRDSARFPNSALRGYRHANARQRARMVIAFIVRTARVVLHDISSGEIPLSQRELLIATSNNGKLREAREILKDLGFRLLTLSDWEAIQAVPETGSTFIENASLKATAYAHQARVLTLAD